MKREIKNIFTFIPLLVPSLLITGPFLPDLFLVLTCLYYIFDQKFINFLKPYLKKNETLIYLSLIVLAMISSVLSEHILDSLKSSFFHLRFLLFAMIYFYLANSNKKFIEYQIILLGLTMFILISDSLLQLFTGKNIMGYEMPVAYVMRPTSFFFNDLKIGSFLCKFSLLLAALCFYKDRFIKYSLFILLLSWVIIFFSGERASFILFSLSIIFIALIFYKSVKFKDNKIFLILLALLIAMVTYKVSQNTKYIQKMIIHPLKELTIIKSDEKFLPSHSKHYLIAYEIFKDNILLGSGPNSFRHECSKVIKNNDNIFDGCSTHPHNFYIQLLSETGIFSLLIALFFYFRLIFIFFKSVLSSLLNRNNNKFKAYILVNIILLISFFPLSTTGNIFNNWNSIHILFALGFFFKLRHDIKNA